ncbi:MAG: hypothetical protein DRI95_06955 [Bacteroidetes bacterium]|nr:MAG: hypothetical protein DRI95_06955 [Bacteroidota bacterium]
MRKFNFFYLPIIFLFVLVLTNCNKNSLTDISRTEVLSENWKLQRNSKLADKTGDVISQSNFKTDNWLNAVVPGTVMGSLVANGEVKDPYFGINLKNIDKEQFVQTWWY